MHYDLTSDVGVLTAHVRDRVWGRVRNLELLSVPRGILVRGSAETYYLKQLAQQAVLEASALPLLANEIQVCHRN